MGIQAAVAGKNMIVEKPADIQPERVDRLIAAGKENGVQIAGIFQARLDPLNLRIRNAIQDGLKPKGVKVAIFAEHHCMKTRGVQKHAVVMETECATGARVKD